MTTTKRTSSLVELTPTECDKRGNRYRPWKYDRISPKLTVEKLREICNEKSMMKTPRIGKNPDGSIAYQYPEKPSLIIKDGRIHTTEDELKEYGQEKCNHQASFLPKLLNSSPEYKHLIEGAERESILKPRHEFLKSAFPVNQTRTRGKLEVTLTRAGLYEWNGTRLGFDLRISNSSSEGGFLDATRAVIEDDSGNCSKVRGGGEIPIGPKDTIERYFYSDDMKDFRSQVPETKDVRIRKISTYDPPLRAPTNRISFDFTVSIEM